MPIDDIGEPTETQIEDALQTVLASVTFADANRLKSFLKFIVEETQAGRRASLRAKIIASDVYGRRPEDGVEQESIVRVDAGRLRRRLDVYYSGEGATDEIRFHVLPGGYVPTFELVELAEPVETGQTANAEPGLFSSRAVFLSAILAIGLVGFGIGWFSHAAFNGVPSTALSTAASSLQADKGLVRSAVNQVSSASLLARTFVEEAHGLIFPSIDPARLGAAELLCQRAVEIAPDLSTGHSCSAFTHAYFAFVTPNKDLGSARLLAAKKEAGTALRINPADPFAQMANAWTQFVEGERKIAIRRAQAAIAIAPDEDFLRNFYGMMMVFDGQAREIINSASPSPGFLNKSYRYHPFIMAGAYFQIGKYQEAIKSLNAAVENEGRTSALVTSIKIAAYEGIGDNQSAEEYAANLMKSWPRNNYQARLRSFFSHEVDAMAISERVDAAIRRLDGL